MAAAADRRFLLKSLLFLALGYMRLRRSRLRKKRKHKCWVRRISKQRNNHGQCHTLFRELKLHDREFFYRYLRMSTKRLEHLLTLGPLLAKKKCRSRETISPPERLLVTLRYLATGDSQQSHSFNFRVGKATVCHIIRDTWEIDIPGPEIIDDFTLPYVLVSDGIFKLEPWLMKPFPGKNLDQEKTIFNYRLSRCRRTIENAFGILAARWRIMRRPIRASVSTVENITKACVCLHNYLKQTDNAFYVPNGFIVAEDNSGTVIPGNWRSIVDNDQSALQPIPRTGSNYYKANAKLVRETYKHYFNSKSGSVPWQLKHINSCGKKL
eukprot:gene2307-2657_t